MDGKLVSEPELYQQVSGALKSCFVGIHAICAPGKVVFRMMEIKYYKVCRLRCRRCGSVMEWHNRSKDDRGPGYPMMCQCGIVGLDPSACLYRILGHEDDWEDSSEEWDDE